MPIVSEADCVSRMAGFHITPDMLCAGGQSGQDSCNVGRLHCLIYCEHLWLLQGDSGGPLTMEDSLGRHVLIGTVSGSKEQGCGLVGSWMGKRKGGSCIYDSSLVHLLLLVKILSLAQLITIVQKKSSNFYKAKKKVFLLLLSLSSSSSSNNKSPFYFASE